MEEPTRKIVVDSQGTHDIWGREWIDNPIIEIFSVVSGAILGTVVILLLVLKILTWK